MRSWKTPALLATIGLCGLGSLFAQGPMLMSSPEPTAIGDTVISGDAPVIHDMSSPTTISSDSRSAPAPLSSGSSYSTPAYETEVHPTVENYPVSSSPSYSSAPVFSESVIHSAPAASCGGCGAPAAPCATGGCEAAPVATCCGHAPQVMMAAPVYAAPMMAQPSCGCQGRGASSFGGYGGGYGMGYGQGYTMGSGSGVAAGLLTPNSNSGGLHTRYPFYNYRAPWYYQGPPSQNVTIVW